MFKVLHLLHPLKRKGRIGVKGEKKKGPGALLAYQKMTLNVTFVTVPPVCQNFFKHIGIKYKEHKKPEVLSNESEKSPKLHLSVLSV